MEIGDLQLNAITREVIRSGKRIPLRNKEFTLLEFLMNHPGEVINRTTLLEKVWDFNATISSNTIETHIALLRKKVDGGFPNKLIKTYHGAGYSISLEA